MFDKKDKDNVCYCETCNHKTAKECIELQCSCCLKADLIRLGHIIVPEDDLSYNEKTERTDEERSREEREKDAEISTLIGNNLGI